MEDTYMTQSGSSPKSAFILLSIISIMVISTLVLISSYFLRPAIEINLKDQLVSSLSKAGLMNSMVRVSGRDVELHGAVSNINERIAAEEAAKQIWGVRQVENHLLVMKGSK